MAAYRRSTLAEYVHAMNASACTPRTALGNFLDDFYSADDEERGRLLADEPELWATAENRRWTTYFAAAAYGLERPQWVKSPKYVLDTPWFLIEHSSLRAWQLFDTPPPFKMRRIFCGDRILGRA